jgi:hypothetical protein
MEYPRYESATNFLRKRLPRNEKVKLSFVMLEIPDEKSCMAIKTEIEIERKGFFVINFIQTSSGLWRISGISELVKLPSDKDFHLLAGWLWGVSAHFGGRLDQLSFQLSDN